MSEQNYKYLFMNEQDKKEFRKNFFCENKDIVLDITKDLVLLSSKKLPILIPAAWLINAIIKFAVDTYCGSDNNNNNKNNNNNEK
jgi:hypothetical protein